MNKVVKSEVIEVKEDFSVSKLDNYTSMEDMLPVAERLIATGFLPPALKKPEQVVMVMMAGRELGFNATSSLRNIHMIQGNTALSVHALGALLKRKGITYELVEDFQLFNKITGGEFKEGDNAKDRDFRTVIRFYEFFHGKLITNNISFSWGEAQRQELTTKPTWQKMAK